MPCVVCTLALLSLDKPQQTITQLTRSLTNRPRDPNTLAWRPVASLSEFSQQQDSSETNHNPEAFASSLCYGCLVPFMELQGPAKKASLPSNTSASSLRLVPAYVKVGQMEEANQEESDVGRSGMRAQIEDFLL